MTKTGVEINKMSNTNSTEKSNETKSWFCETLSKIDQHLARLTKKREKTQIINIKIKASSSLLSPWTVKG